MTCRYCGSFDHSKHCSCGRAITSEKADMCTDCSLATLPKSPTRADPITLPQIEVAVPEEPKVKTDDPFWHTFTPGPSIFWPPKKPDPVSSDDDDYDTGDPPQDNGLDYYANLAKSTPRVYGLNRDEMKLNGIRVIVDPNVSRDCPGFLIDQNSFNKRIAEYASKYIELGMNRCREQLAKLYWLGDNGDDDASEEAGRLMKMMKKEWEEYRGANVD